MAVPPRQDDLAGELDAAAWAEADLALARALRDVALLCEAAARLERARSPARRLAAIAAVNGAALLLRQAVEDASRLRGLQLFGEPGEVAVFDPRRHDAASVSKAGQVRLRAPGVRRANRGADQVILKAQASPTRGRVSGETS